VTGAPPIAVQQYSFGRRAAQEATLRRVAAMGYLGVEFEDLHGVAPERIREVTDELGLAIIAVHPPAPIQDCLHEMIDTAKKLGTETIVDGLYDFTSASELRDLVAGMNRVADVCAAEGITLGYHNHDAEFSTRFDGAMAFDLIMEDLDPRIFVELDTYWAQVGGVDPIHVLRSLGDRVRLLNVADGPAMSSDDDNTAVGSGDVDIPALLEAAPWVDWHIVEFHECATDVFEAVEESYRYLVDSGLSRGRSAPG
jgi:sugar phosphate isomerase/epimerase